MRLARKPLPTLLLAGLFVGSCVGGEDPTGVSVAEVAVSLQPALIPSPADGDALPVNRIHTVVSRYPDGAILRTQRFDVDPTALSWALDVQVPVVGESVQVVVYLYLLNVDPSGFEAVQFSGRTDPMSVSVGTRIDEVDADVVRGPLSNLNVTGISITSAPDTLFVGGDATLRASVETSGSAPGIFWTSLDPTVLGVVDSVATGLAEGTARVVASAGAYADTVSIEVIVPDVDSIHVLPDSADVVVGQSRAYAATLFAASGEPTTGPVVWQTGNTSVATVNASGQVTGVAPGRTTVRATSGDVFDEAVVRVVTAPTGGSVIRWTQPGGGDWHTAANWSLSRVPAGADTVEIDLPGEYTITLDADATIGALKMTEPATLRIVDADLTLTGAGPGPELVIGEFGLVALEDGSVIADGVAIAGTMRSDSLSRLEADSIVNTGELTVGTGALFLPNDGLYFENRGSLFTGIEVGQLFFGTNAAVHHYAGTLTGTGSVVLGQGTTLTLHDDLVIDTYVLGTGSVLVDDAQELTVGPNGAMQISGTSGTPIEIEASRIAVEGTLLVVGVDVRMPGLLDIIEDGIVSMQSGDGPSTFVTGSVVNRGDLHFGSGSFPLRVGPGALGEITNDVLGFVSTSGVSPVVLNAQLENLGDMFVTAPTELRREDENGNPVTALHRNAAGATIDVLIDASLAVHLGGTNPSTFVNSGSMSISDGATLYVENLSNPPSQIVAEATASFDGTGTIDLTGGDVDLIGVNDGVIRPGFLGPGIMTWRGTVPMGPTGVIELEIDGSQPGIGYDQLNISSRLILNGNGVLDLSNSTHSAFMGERFPIITYGERQGDFAQVIMPPNGLGGAVIDTLTVTTPDPLVADTFLVVVLQGPSPIAADWTLDDSEGQSVFDAGGQGNDGTLGSNPDGVDAADPIWTGLGRVGSALSFSGAQVVTVPDATSLEPGQFTVEAFVRSPSPSLGPFRYILSKGGGPSTSTSASYALYTGAGGGLLFYTSVNGSSAATYYSAGVDAASIWDSEWHHVAGTFNGFQVTLWVDGVQVGPPNGAVIGYATPQGDLTIGALDPTDRTYGFIGDIDEVRIWNRVLTAGEIQARASRGGP